MMDPTHALEARTKTLFWRAFGVRIVRGTQPVLPISGVFGQTSRTRGSRSLNRSIDTLDPQPGV
jgi:hypothetical protein